MSLLLLIPLKGVHTCKVLVSSPIDRQIFQRDSFGNCTIPISGSFNNPGSISKIQAKLTSIIGGETTNWVVLPKSRVSFSGKITAPAGWYSLTVQAIGAGGHVNGHFTVPHIGIGEIFIGAGQSLGANYSNTMNTVSDDRINCRSIVNPWRLANDPQLCDSSAPGSGGSFYPPFATDLIARINVPIGIIMLNSGGSYVAEWTPGGAGSGQFFHFIQSAVTMFPQNGFRCMFWVQGEQDAFLGTTQADYFAQLSDVISAARANAKWNMPWCIGSPETFLGPAFNVPSGNYVQVAAGQAQVVSQVSGVFSVDMDNNLPLQDRFDQTHPNHAGCLVMGTLWSQAVINYFGF